MEIKEETNDIQTKTVTLPTSDWALMQNHLMLLAENVGKVGLDSKTLGIVHSNCITFIHAITEQTNGITTNVNS